jgi:hypothetical protein
MHAGPDFWPARRNTESFATALTACTLDPYDPVRYHPEGAPPTPPPRGFAMVYDPHIAPHHFANRRSIFLTCSVINRRRY